MSYAVAVTWGFNFIVALTFPRLLGAFKPQVSSQFDTWHLAEADGSFTSQGAFGWYAAWCLIGWVLILLFVPEVRRFTCTRHLSRD